MRLKNRLFPYPVITNSPINNVFFNKKFLIQFEKDESVNSSSIYFKNIDLDTDSEYLMNKYKEGCLDVLILVECSQTIFRKSYWLSKLDNRTLVLDKNDLNGKVYLSLFIYAKKDFVLITDEVKDDYKGIEFFIDKYDILGADDSISFDVIHYEEEDNVSKSIFAVVPDENVPDDSPYRVSDEGRKIFIYLSKKAHKSYNYLDKHDNFKELFFGLLLIPTLTQSFTKISERLSNLNYDLDDVVSNYKWFISVENSYKKMTNKDLTKEEFLKYSPIEFAQIIFKSPLLKSFDNLQDTFKQKGDNEDEY